MEYLITAGKHSRNAWLLIAVLSVWLIADVFSVLSTSPENLVCRFEDDAFFYATVARNTVEEGKVSFDGVSKTNGFHPLWMGILTVTRFVFPDETGFLRAAGILSSLLLFTAGIFAVKFMSRQFSLEVILPVLIIFLRYMRDFSHLAMETSILIPLAFAALVVLDRVTPLSSKRLLLAFGSLLALTGLARLDASLLAILAGVWAVSRCRWRRKCAVAVFLPGVIAGILYLAVNRLVFHSWLSVSGSIKASGLGVNTLFAKQLFLLSDPMGIRSPWGLYLLFFLLSFAVLFFKKARPSVKVTSLFMILFTASQFFLSSWRLWYWYAYPAVLFCVFVLPLLLQRLLTLFRIPDGALYTAGVILVALSIVPAAFWGWHYGEGNTDDFRVRNMHIAEELNRVMTDSTLIAMGDRAGSFAYFFRGGVVQAEGLAGNAELVNAIKQERLQEYLEEAGVEYILSWTGPGSSVDYTSWDLLVPDRAQSMSPQNRITVYRDDEVGRWPGSNGTVILWQFRESQYVR
ncbi:MAG: hypothetical protein B1H09_02320 [Gemmatimonadaceae bacterium 4484_173]|nr:MAG: hypothetical protein B1H09_02320 [Gemmatimonadaceae bacterium 4484_173]